MKHFIWTLLFILINVCIYSQSYTAKQDINVRKGPGTKYEILGKLSNGTNMEILETTGSWGKINYQGSDGYVSTKLLMTSSGQNIEVGSTTNNVSNQPTNWFPWIIGLIVSGVLIKLFGFRKVFGAIMPGTAKSIWGKYHCTSCGRTQFGRDQKGCPNGGTHQWYKI